MFDFSFAELALVALVALLVVDPKDVPGMLRTAMRWFGELRNVSDEVKGSVKALIDDAQVTDLKDEIAGDLEFMGKPQRYIRDMDGNLQPAYDLTDFIDDQEKPSVSGGEKDPA